MFSENIKLPSVFHVIAIEHHLLQVLVMSDSPLLKCLVQFLTVLTSMLQLTYTFLSFYKFLLYQLLQ